MGKTEAVKNVKKVPKNADDLLLDSKINSYKIDKPQTPLYVIGVVASFLPAYAFHAMQNLPWDQIENLPLFFAIPGVSAYCLSKAYQAMYETEFFKRNVHYGETKSADDEEVLKELRLQASLGWTVFFCNLLFVAMSLFFQMYFLRSTDARFNFLVSPTAAAGLTWLISIKNEEARKKKMGRAL